jgi:hypothetical protein
MSDSDRFWRVYRVEWCVAYASDADGAAGELECRRKFEQEFAGKISPEDWRLVSWNERFRDVWPMMLELRLPVMKGEYRHRPDALRHASSIDSRVLLEGSQDEKKLLDYGRKKLRKGSVDSQGVDAADPARRAAGQEG